MKMEVVAEGKKIIPKKKPTVKKKQTKAVAVKPKQEIAIKSETGYPESSSIPCVM